MKKLNNKALLKRIKNRKDIKELFPEEVIENMYLCKAFSNEEIIRQGDKLDKIYYLLEGRISVHTYLDNGKKIILTNGFVKKTQKTPAKEIETAEKYRADYMSRH